MHVVGCHYSAFSCLYVLGGAMAPVSSTPHVPSPHSTAVPPSPPPGGIPAAVSQITHPAGTLGHYNEVFISIVYVLFYCIIVFVLQM